LFVLHNYSPMLSAINLLIWTYYCLFIWRRVSSAN